MLKRIRYEIRTFFPVTAFLFILYILSCLSGPLLLQQGAISPRAGEVYLLLAYLIQVAILVSLAILISYNFSKELTGREGLKTFLAPMPGWKVILAKYLASLLLCLVFLLLTRVSAAFIEDRSLQPIFLEIRTAMLDRGLILSLVWGWFGMDGMTFLYFFLWWTMVYFFGAFTWTRLYYGYRRRIWALSLSFSQPLFFFSGLFAIDWIIYGLNRLFPLYIEKGSLALRMAEKTRDPALFIERVYRNGLGYMNQAAQGEADTIGHALISYLLVALFILVFFYLAQRYWEKLDR